VSYVVIGVIGAALYGAFRFMMTLIIDGEKAKELNEILKQKSDSDRKRAEAMLKDKTIDQVIDDLKSGRF
jgi:hypothetical protein